MVDNANYIVISSDDHAGAALLAYKPYLESRYHDEFDAWASTYRDSWSQFNAHEEEAGAQSASHNPNLDEDEFHFGVASYASKVNWDSALRDKFLDQEGIAGEVLFPNTAPPFFPSAMITAGPPTTQKEYEYRFAGIKAHNRWLVDFVAESPDRRAGIGQIFLNDVDAAIEEARWAKEAGLKGLLLPPDHPLGLSNIYYPKYEPFWAACADLDIPLVRHSMATSEGESPTVGDVSPVLGLFELQWYMHRPLVQMILMGVFDRYPNLRLILAENRAAPAWVIVKQLDAFVKSCKRENSIGDIFGHACISRMQRMPSEYFATNVFHATFLDATDIEQRHEIGVENIMWAADFPHHEGTYPYTRLAYRLLFAELPEDERRRMMGLNAIRTFGLNEAALRRIADRIGPSVESVGTPIPRDEIPDEAGQFCPTFAPAYDWITQT